MGKKICILHTISIFLTSYNWFVTLLLRFYNISHLLTDIKTEILLRDYYKIDETRHQQL